ncbi:MAG: hypothetical protein LBE33_01065 [Zoogloeaceae bacterium]|jgi:hypothetical protein|nr:hypothetical protein [Zoogloeaceae bacterium]
MDTFDVEFLEANNPVTGALTDYVKFLLNGVDFLDISHNYELPFMIAEGRPQPIDKQRFWRYRWGAADSLLGKDQYDGSEEGEEQGKSLILGCKCGFDDDWPLYARIIISKHTVTWKDFENPFRAQGSRMGVWSYEALGPFVFDKKSYMKAVDKFYLPYRIT